VREAEIIIRNVIYLQLDNIIEFLAKKRNYFKLLISMRIHIKTTPSNQALNFNHLHLLAGTIHKWFGENNFHDDVSLYSFSHLMGAKSENGGLTFPHGATFFISCWDNDLTKLLVKGIQDDPEMFFGLKAKELILQENPDLSAKTHFQIGSPVFIQRNRDNGKKRFYYFENEEASQLMQETLHTKMTKAGLPPDETLKINFDQSYHRKSTKKIAYKHGNNIIEIRANWCPLIIEGKAETKVFAWNVGIGNSTGIGFGAIK